MPSSLNDALSAGPMILAPGAYDALTARLVAQHGFPAVYMTGAGTSVAHGYPDYGLLTMTEMAGTAARMAEAVDVPVIADADTGYGNELNVVRTVRAYARAGVAAIHIEDQTFPKRCGHLAGQEIVDRDVWLGKIRAAVESRPDAGLLIIARTDARAVAGLDEAIGRARAALALGADVAFVEAPQTAAEIAAIPAAIDGPCLFNVVPGGRSPEVSLADLQSWGYRIAIFPSLLITPAVAACEQALSALAPNLGARPAAEPADLSGGPAALFQRVGAAEWDRLRDRYEI
ncbi:MAG: isocitrate lyase/PEP mutase family protein [Streptosporangiaceae bacterium]